MIVKLEEVRFRKKKASTEIYSGGQGEFLSPAMLDSN